MTRPRGFMDIDLFRKIITGLKPYLYDVCLYFQGEPMLHPGFFSFIEAAGKMRTTVSTNGHFLSVQNAEKLVAADLGKLIVSLDGSDQETYQVYRQGGDIERVMDGLRNVAEAKSKAGSKMKVELQFLVSRHNQHQVGEAGRIARTNGATLRLKSMQVIHEEDTGYWVPSISKYSRYTRGNDSFMIKSRLPDRCFRLYFNPVITWDGKVVPCCFDKDASYIMGDLTADTFRSIWNGEKYSTFRKRVLTERGGIDICRNCTSGLKHVRY
jgi:radical SAM protein with 4Fe4S-binding SPASM domain